MVTLSRIAPGAVLKNAWRLLRHPWIVAKLAALEGEKGLFSLRPPRADSGQANRIRQLSLRLTDRWGKQEPEKETFEKRFQILEELSANDTLSVYKAIDGRNNRPIIIRKMPTSSWGSRKQYLDATMKLNHKNIAHVYETLEDDKST